MKLISESKFKKAYDLKGRPIYVKVITEQSKSGRIFTRSIAIRQKRVS